MAACDGGFCSRHRGTVAASFSCRPAARASAAGNRENINTTIMVPAVGLEPTLPDGKGILSPMGIGAGCGTRTRTALKPQGFKPRASTSSAKPAAQYDATAQQAAQQGRTSRLASCCVGVAEAQSSDTRLADKAGVA